MWTLPQPCGGSSSEWWFSRWTVYFFCWGETSLRAICPLPVAPWEESALHPLRSCPFQSWNTVVNETSLSHLSSSVRCFAAAQVNNSLSLPHVKRRRNFVGEVIGQICHGLPLVDLWWPIMPHCSRLEAWRQPWWNSSHMASSVVEVRTKLFRSLKIFLRCHPRWTVIFTLP